MQKITISTIALASIVKRVSKGLVKNKFLPYSGYIMISGNTQGLTFAVNDGSNAYIHKINKDYGITEEFSLCVDGEKLLQLVSRLSKSTTVINIHEKMMQIVCGGKYAFNKEEDVVPVLEFEELMLQDPANPVVIPEMVLPPISDFITAQAGLSKLVVDVRLMGYLVDINKIVTTNSVKVSSVVTKKTTEDSFYLTTRMVDLYGTFTDEEATIYLNNGINIIKTDTKLIYGPVQPGHDTFPELDGVFGVEFDHNFTINSGELIESLERLKVFDGATVFLLVVNGVVHVSLDPKKHTYEQLVDMGDATIGYKAEFDVNEFKDLVAKHNGDVTVHFGSDVMPAIKLTSDGLTQLIAQIGDEE